MKVNIKDAISEYNMITSGDHVVVALSGGADSVSLLIALDMLKDELQIQLSACHINHNLRGLESDNDEMFVRELCEKRDITLEVFSVDINSLKEKHKSIEETAREARYKCFESFGENVKIATAHTASDNVETVIFNMVRGTALKGLCGIPAVRGNIIRPLIYSSREDVLKFLSDNKQDYVNDNSNFSDIYSRNKIRLNVLPELRQINPSLESGFINMCKALKSDEGFLSELSENGLNECTYGNNQYNAQALIKYEKPILHRIISKILAENEVAPSGLRIIEIENILKTGKGKINLCKNKFAVVDKNVFCVQTIHQKYRKNS